MDSTATLYNTVALYKYCRVTVPKRHTDQEAIAVLHINNKRVSLDPDLHFPAMYFPVHMCSRSADNIYRGVISMSAPFSKSVVATRVHIWLHNLTAICSSAKLLMLRCSADIQLSCSAACGWLMQR